MVSSRCRADSALRFVRIELPQPRKAVSAFGAWARVRKILSTRPPPTRPPSVSRSGASAARWSGSSRSRSTGSIRGLFRRKSEDLEQARRALAAADAHGDDGIFDAAALALDQRVADAACAQHAERVADRDRAAVVVERVMGADASVAAIRTEGQTTEL